MYGDYAKHEDARDITLAAKLPLCEITGEIHAFCPSETALLKRIMKGLRRSEILSVAVTSGTPSVQQVQGSIDQPQDTQNKRTTASQSHVNSNTKSSEEASKLNSIIAIPDIQTLEAVATPSYFELCVNLSKTRISLGEIQLVDSRHGHVVKTDLELFAQIRQKYDALRRGGLYQYLYRPFDIHFVRFGVHRGGLQTGIYQKPLAIPPEVEVTERRYHYHECPLDPLPPIDSRTFFHYFWEHSSHPKSSGNPAFDTLFYNRLPKKLGCSMLMQTDPGKLHVGWGVHIIEGPNKPLLAWLATAILALSFAVSLSYDIGYKNKESGFAIGQWMVAVLATALTAIYFHLADIA